MALYTLHNVPYNQVEGLDKRLYFPQKKEPYGGMLIVSGGEQPFMVL